MLRIESAEKRRDIRGRGRDQTDMLRIRRYVADRIRGKKAGHHGRIGERMCLGM